MTISSTTRKAGPFTGNGVTVAFPFAFKVFAASDVVAVRTNLSDVETTLASPADYSVSLNPDQDASPGGTVTLVSALTSGWKLTITSGVPSLQAVELTNSGGFYPDVINNALDRLTVLVQQVAEETERAVKVQISSSTAPDALIADLFLASSNAATSESNAAASASAASTSETNAANSEAAAAGYAASIDPATLLTKAGNLSGLANVPASRTNLGLGTAATANTGTASGNVPLVGTASDTETVAGLSRRNTTAEAQAGTLDEGHMTPLKTAQAISAMSPSDGQFRTIQVFTASGTYTKPAGLKRVKVTVVGGSGGGGSGQSDSAGNFSSGGSGGGAGGAIKLIATASVGSTETVTVGGGGSGGAGGLQANGTAGGTSSFGAHVSASGGGAGTGSGTAAGGGGGAAGSGSGGEINYSGAPGNTGEYNTTTNFIGGSPGGSAAFGFGSGGMGGRQDLAGGAGTAGIVIVEEFY